MNASEIVEIVTETLAPFGFDLVWPMQVGRYNRAEQRATRLPEPGGPGSLALVLGNTKALWPVFLDHLRRNPDDLSRGNPLDRYADDAMRAAADATVLSPTVRPGHGLAGRSFSLQRAAVATGAVHLAPCHLGIHPDVGLWFGLRGVLVFAEPGPDEPFWDHASPCDSCADQPCVPLLDIALGQGKRAAPRSIRPRWKPWLAVRDACPVGRTHRYSDDQVTYHYGQDRDLLAAVVGGLL